MSASAAGPSSDSSPSGRETVDRAVDGARQQVNGDGDGEAPNRAVELLGRVGMASYGLVHLLIGVIAVQIAVTGGGQADQQGALSTLAAESFGSPSSS